MRSTPASRHSGLKRALFHFSVAAALSVGVTTGAQAAEFGTPLEDLNGSWDTTLSVSTVQRVQSSSNDIICDSNGGNAYSCNYDDGTLNYGTGTVSEQLKFLSEIQLDYKNIGLFVRGTGYYDFKADNTDRTPLSKEAKDDVEKDLRMLDAYLYGRFDIGSMPAEVRVGKQVVNWGESTFFLSGMSALNIFDTAKLRGAAVNLREGLLPQHQVYASISPTDNLSLEGFYQYKWNRTQPDAVGTWFSSNDFAARGGRVRDAGFWRSGAIRAPTSRRWADSLIPTSSMCRGRPRTSPRMTASTALRCATLCRTSSAAPRSGCITPTIIAVCRC